MWVKKITVLHKRNECIWCGSCVLLDKEHWTMDTSDGKACLKWSKRKWNTYMVGAVDEDMIDATHDAASACPVQIIKVSQ